MKVGVFLFFCALVAVGFSSFSFSKPPDGLPTVGIALIMAAGIYLARVGAAPRQSAKDNPLG